MAFKDTINLETARAAVDKSLTNYMRRDVYGLMNPVCFCGLLNIKMIIKALDLDDESDNTFLTETERGNLLSNITIPRSCSGC